MLAECQDSTVLAVVVGDAVGMSRGRVLSVALGCERESDERGMLGDN